MVMGSTPEQTARMMRKLHNDPIIKLVSEKYEVTLIPISISEL
jgi:hypothetical protein